MSVRPGGRLLSTYEYSSYTHPFSGRVRGQIPLPRIVEPAQMPLVSSFSSEELVRVEGEGVRSLPVYQEVGWENAVGEVRARRSVVEKLHRVSRSLPEGFGLFVFDAWRPLALQKEIYEAAYSDSSLPAGFVTPPSMDPRTPPPHLTGGTVDLTLTWQGQALRLGSEFDDFTEAAAVDSLEGVECVERDLRRMLFWAMQAEGFVVISCEWWHFEWGTRRWAAITGGEAVYGAVESLIPLQRRGE